MWSVGLPVRLELASTRPSSLPVCGAVSGPLQSGNYVSKTWDDLQCLFELHVNANAQGFRRVFDDHIRLHALASMQSPGPITLPGAPISFLTAKSPCIFPEYMRIFSAARVLEEDTRP